MTTKRQSAVRRKPFAALGAIIATIITLGTTTFAVVGTAAAPLYI